ncbi:GerAB/ArcD/ProY family transporter [Alteribacter populi]|uniref:GerAB/ArcD/ProY family transporter n=1 Tax=Alteribacter populi TaxID=2011011 RepID=UPI000BBAB96A|nr:GerAB/ArcD/ProY family transporter [Alteribacter populi]
MNDNLKITKGQLFFFIVQTQIGIGILGLPFNVFEEAQWDGWMSVLISGLAIQVVIFITYGLASRFPDELFFQYIHKLVGRFFGKVITLIYTFYFTAVCILILVLYDQMIDIWLFPNTPNWVIMLLLITAALYLTREKLHIITRFYVFVSILLVLVIIILLISLTTINPLYILPIGYNGIPAILKGVLAAMQAMIGYGVFLYIFPYVAFKKKTEVLLTVTYANILVTGIYTFTVAITFMFFSPQEIKLVPQPLLYMLKTFTSPIVDRLDLLFLAIWIVSVTTSLMTYLYLASLSSAQLLKGVPRKKLVTFLAFFVYFIALGPENDLTIQNLADGVDNANLIATILIPFILYLIAIFRGKPNKGAVSNEKVRSS